jgi:hypothetical protein
MYSFSKCMRVGHDFVRESTLYKLWQYKMPFWSQNVSVKAQTIIDSNFIK